ncbi:hypothetical protein QC761_311370 [Podospora bellae-mahoneyi]|uniref:Cyanovirin-N domain-containing protein n=1 Tax=Podospora bellae-mahoneyi TaxID=2093777 RepID=A0ABR0FPZ8_9PEZI|nr:hypothetical protein QC761_311370 [Podospora bellae-mahoneyi]
MKVSFLTTLFLSVALALETPVLERRARAGTLRKFNGAAPPPRAAKVPSSAPAGYKTSVATANVKLSVDSLTPATLRRREDQVETRQVSASDFFECYNANPAPRPQDCDVIVDQVSSSNDLLIVSASSCLVFSFGTCQAFFCSLCTTLTTDTNFIADQLDIVDALCVEGGQTGSIVGEDAPQWDAGFTYAGAGLPFYDVC